jgi:hypothetical protein
MSFELTCHIIHETDNAILVLDPASETEIWIPLSQVDEIHRHKDSAVLKISDWIARQKGLV